MLFPALIVSIAAPWPTALAVIGIVANNPATIQNARKPLSNLFHIHASF
jgi:hypothetical protein